MLDDKKVAAILEKEQAETLIKIEDYKGAREKLRKAQNLYPALENVSRMLTVCNVLCAANTLPGVGPDWYWVLQSSAATDESHIRLKYQTLVALLEPIRNKFPGTGLALTLIHRAFSVLSDTEKRSAFDLKRNSFEHVNSQGTSDRAMEATSQSFSGSELVKSDISNRINRVSGSLCGKLSMLTKCSPAKSPQPNYYNFDDIRKTEVFSVGQIWSSYDQENMPRRYALVNKIGYAPFKLSVTWLKPAPVALHEKKWCAMGLPVGCGYFGTSDGNMVVSVTKMFSHLISRVKDLMAEGFQIYPKKGEVWGVYRDWRPVDWCSDPKLRKGCKFLMVEILMDYVKNRGLMVAPLERVEGFKSVFRRCTDKGSQTSFEIPSTDFFRFSHNVPVYKFTGREDEKVDIGMIELDPLAVPRDLVDGTRKPSEGGRPSSGSTITLHPSLSPPLKLQHKENESMQPKWSPQDFISGHIWAIYDGLDSMPRRYVIVNDVILAKCVVRVTFLEPNPTFSEEIHSVEENLPFVCGMFKAGNITLNLSVSLFSHLVTCEHNTDKSLYRILPKKGDIWAMYKNWNAKWKQSNYNQSECQIVEILTDFSEADEIRIASLMEVPGCMTFFQKQLCNGFELVRSIPRAELLSFSHEIPSFVVPGGKIHGIPEGALHLEPDALPPNLANYSGSFKG